MPKLRMNALRICSLSPNPALTATVSIRTLASPKYWRVGLQAKGFQVSLISIQKVIGHNSALIFSHSRDLTKI
jgi:hypothetical protein